MATQTSEASIIDL